MLLFKSKLTISLLQLQSVISAAARLVLGLPDRASVSAAMYNS